jgi:hypothetical protein
MGRRITRRAFGTVGAATGLSAALFPTDDALGSPQPAATQGRSVATLDVRPYQLMCIVCRLGAGCTDDLGDVRLTNILKTVRQDRTLPLALRCNVDTVYRYQNPGHEQDTGEGELYNAKRDLDILRDLGLAPGDVRPAVDLFERLLASVATARGICGYDKVTSPTWQGCSQAASGHYEKGRDLGMAAILPARDAKERLQAKKTSVAAIYEAKTLRIRPHHLLCMSCVYGERAKGPSPVPLTPLQEDNLFEAIDAIQKNPGIPVTLVVGATCVVCPPCSNFDPATNLCLGGVGMALRDQKKDLDTLQRIGLKYGDTLPACKLYRLVYDRIASVRDICAYGDGELRGREWSICGYAKQGDAYQRARAAQLGIKQSES